jgi:hypothetical protein
MAVAKFMVMVVTLVVALFRRRVNQVAKASLVPRDVCAMHPRLVLMVTVGMVLGLSITVLARVLEDGQSLVHGVPTSTFINVGIVIGFGSTALRNFLDALRLRQLTRSSGGGDRVA